LWEVWKGVAGPSIGYLARKLPLGEHAYPISKRPTSKRKPFVLLIEILAIRRMPEGEAEANSLG
jgi:hypothetical protein